MHATLAASPISDSDLDRHESNRASHRRLDKRLIATDLRLQAWSPWARPRYELLGYPSRSVTEKSREGGILARNTVPHPPEWPKDVAQTEYHVARLELRELAAVCAHYFHLALLREQRVTQYALLVRKLIKQRSQEKRLPRLSRTLGEGAFENDLARARWVLKAALQS